MPETQNDTTVTKKERRLPKDLFRSIRQGIMALLQRYPDQWIIEEITKESLTLLTEITVKFTNGSRPFRLQYDVKNTPDDFTEQIHLRESSNPYSGISYRLDISDSPASRRILKSLKKSIHNNPQDTFLKFISDQTVEEGNTDNRMYLDRYAETTIEPETMVGILQSVQSCEKPKNIFQPFAMTLQEVMEQMGNKFPFIPS